MSPRTVTWSVVRAALLAMLIGATVLPLEPALAASGPKVVVIVGPSGSSTTTYRRAADQAVAEARRHTSNVVRVYSPNATWARVKSAVANASIVIFFGRASASQSAHPTSLERRTKGGFGLNPRAGHGNSATRYYGETSIRTLRLASNAVVLLYRMPTAAGNGPAGRTRTTITLARRRVDNYGAGFIVAGASAVIAEASGSPAWYVRGIFTRSVTLDALWRALPSAHGHVKAFSSSRVRGALGRLDPVRATSGYLRSIVGRLSTTTTAVRNPGPARSATPPPPPPRSPVSGTYGSAQGDSRNNHEIGGRARARLSYRFRASTTSAVTSVRVQQRGGPVYSGGNGGSIRMSIQTDSNGVPSGTIVASRTFSPGNPAGHWEKWDAVTISGSATLTAGRAYHLVFDNVSSNPTANWISLNDLYYWGGPYSPRQPAYSDDFAVLYASPTTWAIQRNDTPIMDIAYANGAHDGVNYIGSLADAYGSISGSANKVREHFRVSGSSRTVSAVSVKVKRISGTGSLTIKLQKGDGTLIDWGTVAAGSIPLGRLPTGGTSAALSGNTWATVNFGASYTLAAGQTYDLVLSTTSGTQYIAVPVQEGTTKGLRSRAFTDGDGQKTTNGSSWANLYQWTDVARTDLQFVFR